MTKDDVIRMAREAGFVNSDAANIYQCLERFAELVQLTTVTPAQIAHAEAVERSLTDEIIADLWHQNGGFHHHFARAVERYLKGEK